MILWSPHCGPLATVHSADLLADRESFAVSGLTVLQEHGR